MGGQTASGGSASLTCPSGGGAGAGGMTTPPACTPDQMAAKLAAALAAPVIPTVSAGGVNLSNASGDATTKSDVDAQLCFGDDLGDYIGDGSTVEGYGPNQELFFSFSATSSGLQSAWMQPGYTGAWTLQSRPGSVFSKDGIHTYVLTLQQQITKDGNLVTIDWSSPTNPSNFLNELYDAAIYQSAAFVPPEPGVLDGSPLGSCAVAGHCVIGQFSDGSHYEYIPSIGFGWLVASSVMGSAVASTPTNFQMYRTRLLGFSLANVLIKADTEGPVALQNHVGVSPNPCRITLGQPFSKLLSDCVQVTGDATKDALEAKKLLSGSSHDVERFFLSTEGVSMGLRRPTLGDTSVLAKDATPAANDTISDVVFDQSMVGSMANDYLNDDPNASAKDYHGGGLVWLEMARRAQAELQSYRTDVCANPAACPSGQAPIRTLGDPSCLGPNVKAQPDGTFVFPQGCTGLEGFITTAPHLINPVADEPFLDAVARGKSGSTVGAGALVLGLKPGSPKAVICHNATTGSATGCTAAAGGAVGGVFTTSHARIVQAMGGGDPKKLPVVARDVGFFVKHYVAALARYFKAVAKGTEDVQAVHSVELDPDALSLLPFGTFVDGTYVYRDGPEPLTMTVTVDRGNDIVDLYRFTRMLYRGETDVYRSMLDQAVPGAAIDGAGDDVRISNVAGSKLLQTLYGKNPACATSASPSCLVGPPLGADGKAMQGDDGKPLLTGYEGAILANGPLSLGTNGVKIHAVSCDPAVSTVEFPSRVSPFVPSMLGTPPAFTNVVPWADQGFVLPTAAGVDQPVAASTLALQGQTLFIEPLFTTGAGDAATFQAIRARRFYGRAFVCNDDATHELLAVHSYEAGEVITAWLDAHPAAAAKCGMVTRANADGSLDVIASRTWGITLKFDSGGTNHLSSVLVWDPAAAP